MTSFNLIIAFFFKYTQFISSQIQRLTMFLSCFQEMCNRFHRRRTSWQICHCSQFISNEKQIDNQIKIKTINTGAVCVECLLCFFFPTSLNEISFWQTKRRNCHRTEFLLPIQFLYYGRSTVYIIDTKLDTFKSGRYLNKNVNWTKNSEKNAWTKYKCGILLGKFYWNCEKWRWFPCSFEFITPDHSPNE